MSGLSEKSFSLQCIPASTSDTKHHLIFSSPRCRFSAIAVQPLSEMAVKNPAYHIPMQEANYRDEHKLYDCAAT